MTLEELCKELPDSVYQVRHSTFEWFVRVENRKAICVVRGKDSDARVNPSDIATFSMEEFTALRPGHSLLVDIMYKFDRSKGKPNAASGRHKHPLGQKQLNGSV